MNNQRFFAYCGILAPVLFTILVITASLLRPGYSQTLNFISDLGVGSYAFLQNLNFIIFGLLSVGLALGLEGGLPHRKRRSTKAGITLVILFGLMVMMAGVFPEDYLLQVPHNLVSALAFLFIIAAQLLVWKGLKDADTSLWGGYRTYCLVSGILSILLLVVLRVAISTDSDYQGAVQRIFLAVPWIWIGASGLKLYFLDKRDQDLK
ncbi:MAG: DUF998 domain-containing protein [Methanobacteriaceae archaeon]